MKFHIVQINEKINDIAKNYNISAEEIIKHNRHINDINKILPGMKLRLPILSDEVNEQLKENFLNIEKYYPNLDNYKDVVDNEEIKSETNNTNQTNQTNQDYQNPYNVTNQQQYYPNNQQQTNYSQQQMYNQQLLVPQYNYNPYLNYQQIPYYHHQRNDNNEQLKEPIYQNTKLENDIKNQQPYQYQSYYQPLNAANYNQNYEQQNSIQNDSTNQNEPKETVDELQTIDNDKIFGNSNFDVPICPNESINYYNQIYNDTKNTENNSNNNNKKPSISTDDIDCEHVKEIRVDLRKVYRKTKIKKKDTLDLL